MPYLNLDLDYHDHPKTKRLVGLLGRGAEALPIRLWCYCGKYHADDGRLAGYSAQEIESICAWWGRKGEMIEAFVKVGFLKPMEAGYEVHEWLEHQGHLGAFRERGKKAAQARWEKYRSNATSIAQAQPEQCPVPNQTVPTEPEIKKEKEGEREEEPPALARKDFLKLGEFKNVKLTLTEHERLKLLYGEKDTAGYIESLSGHLTSTGTTKYKSHYATLRNWLRRDGKVPFEICTAENPMFRDEKNPQRFKHPDTEEALFKTPERSDKPEGIPALRCKHCRKVVKVLPEPPAKDSETMRKELLTRVGARAAP